MSGIGIRRCGAGYVVGPMLGRLRHAEPDVELRPCTHYGTLPKALRAARKLLAPSGSSEASTTARGVRAEPTKPLCKQGKAVLSHLKVIGPLTRMSAAEALRCWNLPARIYDIRQAYGDDSVETVMEGPHAVYHWRGE